MSICNVLKEVVFDLIDEVFPKIHTYNALGHSGFHGWDIRGVKLELAIKKIIRSSIKLAYNVKNISPIKKFYQ